MSLKRGPLGAAPVERRSEDHKGTFGHVLVVGGSRGMLGAPVLAARAALRSGAGLVTLAVPAGLQAQAAGLACEALSLGLPEDRAGAFAASALPALERACAARRYSVLALGPGLSLARGAARLAVEALRRIDLPAVIDADALNALSALKPAAADALFSERRQACVFTPHPGELARCLGLSTARVQADRRGCALALARRWRGVVVLKGHRSIVRSCRGQALVNDTGGPGLAKGGSGDVLTGLIAGLWAQALSSGRVQGDAAFWAAALGTRLHGLAGEIAERRLTPWAMTAGDVVLALPEAFAASARRR
ncbi:MAG: NAD(P)H-hydrate dehydratase [Elusimicrobia bacterium]|nr:NAD(P)H-hydrate dehydratase [Elusimicrobiota bacterium]MDE2236765.1 NAD(P)H-hydrate dehydratase [Elusimicrobiota bacterium]MDE2425090.1 NAD(P)H-hydrate dehydratase [Elusimicrobiota bacterium]